MNELMTVSAVARALCRSQEGIRYLANQGKLKCQRTSSGQRLFLASEVEKFIATGKNGSRPLPKDESDDSDRHGA